MDAQEDPVLTGKPASPQDAFWAKKLWELEAEGPSLLTQASQQLMSLTAIVSGIYLAAIGLLGVKENPCFWIRILSLTPYLAWLPAFLCAFVAYRPQQLEVVAGDSSDCRRQFLELASSKRRWSQASQLLVFLGLVVAVAVVAAILSQGPVPVPPSS